MVARNVQRAREGPVQRRLQPGGGRAPFIEATRASLSTGAPIGDRRRRSHPALHGLEAVYLAAEAGGAGAGTGDRESAARAESTRRNANCTPSGEPARLGRATGGRGRPDNASAGARGTHHAAAGERGRGSEGWLGEEHVFAKGRTHKRRRRSPSGGHHLQEPHSTPENEQAHRDRAHDLGGARRTRARDDRARRDPGHIRHGLTPG
jgi:hypothetical protein